MKRKRTGRVKGIKKKPKWCSLRGDAVLVCRAKAGKNVRGGEVGNGVQRKKPQNDFKMKNSKLFSGVESKREEGGGRGNIR